MAVAVAAAVVVLVVGEDTSSSVRFAVAVPWVAEKRGTARDLGDMAE